MVFNGQHLPMLPVLCFSGPTRIRLEPLRPLPPHRSPRSRRMTVISANIKTLGKRELLLRKTNEPPGR